MTDFEDDTEDTKEVLDILDVMNAVRKHLIVDGTITEKNRVPKESKSGEIDCPICKTGKIFYTIASYNGHTHGKCGNLDCFVNWME